MNRFLLALAAILVGLLVYDRLDHSGAKTPPPAPAQAVAAEQRSVTVAAPRTSSANALTIVPSGGTPALDLMARLEGRRRLARAAQTTYFDSLFIDTDSLVRRWPDQQGKIFVVAVPPNDSMPGVPLRGVIERALSTWESAGLGLRFSVRTDTTGANIVALAVPNLGEDRAGQTDLKWTLDGAIHSATITLSQRDQEGRPLPQPLLHAIAVHEIGHALGLAHSPKPDDVMFPTTQTGVISARDRATIALLYQLPPGTIREVSP